MIYILSHSYPYSSNWEIFLDKEIAFCQKNFSSAKFCIVPIYQECEKSKLSENSSQIKACKPLLSSKLNCFCTFLFSLFTLRFWKIVFSSLNSFEKLKQSIIYYCCAVLYLLWFKKNKSNFAKGDVIYSYWLHYNALAIALAKEKGYIPNFVKCISRSHNYDLFDDQNQYRPYREYSLQALDNVYACSSFGAEFLQKKHPKFSNIISTAYLGVEAYSNSDYEKIAGLSPTNGEISICSCSYLRKVKRVDMLLDAIVYLCQRHRELNFVWTHFGGGAEEENLKKLIEEHKASCKNLRVILYPCVSNTYIREAYTQNFYHFFASASESEGLPVSSMEAISAAIPLVITDAGGSREIACEKTGKLLSLDFSKEDFAKAAEYVIENNAILRKSALEFFRQNFNQEINYTKFYRSMGL